MITGIVDSVVLALMPEVAGGLAKAVGGPLEQGYRTEQYLAKMDEAGVEVSILLASKGGGHDVPGEGHFDAWEVPAKGVASIVSKWPDRFRALIGIDPTRPKESLGEVETAIRSMGFVGAHLYPHWWGWAPDEEIYYPFYEACVDLDVAIQIQVGSSLVPFLPSVGHPMTLERVAIQFPKLTIVASHTGWPWVDEMIAVMQNHPNVYLTTSCHYPTTDWANPVSGLRPLPKWDRELVRFINNGSVIGGARGYERVLFGSDFPEWEYSLMIDEGRAIMNREAFDCVYRDNARRVFVLDEVRQ